MEQKITRTFNFEVRAENNEQYGNYITGVPIVFDAATDLGYYTEIIERCALDKTDLKDVRFLINHNTNGIPLARSRNNNENSTMQMMVTEEGMGIRVNLDTENNQEARALYSAIKRGDITGMSFMFKVNTDEDEWEDIRSEHPTRHIREISRVYEVSAVTFPAYEQTSISARDAKEALESARATLDSVKREVVREELEEKIKKFKEEV